MKTERSRYGNELSQLHRNLKAFVPKCKELISMRNIIDTEHLISETRLVKLKENIMNEDRSKWGIDVEFIADNNIDLGEVLKTPNITKKFLLRNVY